MRYEEKFRFLNLGEYKFAWYKFREQKCFVKSSNTRPHCSPTTPSSASQRNPTSLSQYICGVQRCASLWAATTALFPGLGRELAVCNCGPRHHHTDVCVHFTSLFTTHSPQPPPGPPAPPHSPPWALPTALFTLRRSVTETNKCKFRHRHNKDKELRKNLQS